jgi:hypothetical protein
MPLFILYAGKAVSSLLGSAAIFGRPFGSKQGFRATPMRHLGRPGAYERVASSQ